MAFRVLLPVLLLVANLTQAQWFWQNPMPQGNTLRDIKIISPLIGWAVGNYGTIIKTTNGGTTWDTQTSGTTEDLLGVSFTNANNGTVVGLNGTILRTTNGGVTWIQQSSVGGDLSSVSFIDANIGTTVGDGGVILRTTNGGVTWIQQSSVAGDLYSVSFIDANIGTAVGRFGKILRTTNGGVTWIEQTSGTTGELESVSFTDANNGTAVGYIVGGAGIILRTTNGGVTWIEQTSGTTNGWTSVSFTDANNGTVVGGIILRTTNGGVTWIEQSSGSTQGFLGVSFIDVSKGTAVGQYGTIFTTTNGGTTWTSQTSGTTATLRGVSFTDLNTGWVVGGSCLNTTDGGATWIEGVIGGNDVFFIDVNNGWIVGNSIFKTTNAGVTWIEQLNNGQSFTSVAFNNINNGMVVGYFGTILTTTNSGVTWITQASGTTNDLLDVSFISPDIATAVGSWGIIIRTTNGGETWIQQISGAPPTVWLNSVSFTDANTGTTVGGGIGPILRTTDGGDTWTQQGTFGDLVDVSFIDTYTGIAVGTFGSIFRTTDGGTTWVLQASGTTNHLLGAALIDQNVATVVGAGGTILRTTNGGGVNPDIDIITPNGGENWQVDGTYDITWNYTNVENVKIEYTTDNGLSWLPPIIPSTPCDGSYEWTVPNTPSTQCKVRISDVTNPSVYDESDGVFKLVYRIPVIFIPGIMGSPLFNDEDFNNTLYRNPLFFFNDEYIWADALQLGLPIDTFLDVLQMSNDGITSPYNIKVAPIWGDESETIDELLGVKPLSYYSDLIDALKATPNNYNLDNFDIVHNGEENLYIFTYDWRKSISTTALQLSNLIENIMVWNNVDKVNLVCHSMGGLVAKKYINESTRNKINKIIFVATPHLGAPKILSTMATGELFGLMDIISSNEEIRYITRNMASAYLLMPSSNYTNTNINNGQNTRDIDLYNYTFKYPNNVSATYQQMLDFYSNIVLPIGFTFNSYLINQGDIERQSIENVDFGNIKVYNIVGFGERTIGRVEYWKPISFLPGKFNEKWNLTGDGTVPLRSAEIVSPTKTNADFFVKEEKHTDLPSSVAGKQIIKALLREPAIFFSMPNKIYYNPPESYSLSLWQAFVGSPVSLHAYDSQGNHTGSLTDTTWETNIPNSEYFHGDLRDPSSHKGILLSPNDNYFFKIKSINTTDKFDLVIDKIVNGYETATIYFDSVAIQNQTEAICSLSTNIQDIKLNMDYDGNGIIDSTILPTSTNYCLNDEINEGWNMLSLPYLSEQNLKSTLFPTATSNAFWFNGGYVVCDTLEARRGYWLKFDNPFNKISCGQRLEDTIHINAGWNMIGCINENVPIGNIDTEPPGILNSSFFGYSGGYIVADTLRTGKGYWINSNSSGIIRFNQSTNKIANDKIVLDKNWARITIKDNSSREATLYFSEEVSTGNYQMPPLPPAGAFDARFESGNMVEDLNRGNKTINIMGADYPIRINVRGTNIFLRDRVNGGLLNLSVNDGEEIVIYDSRIDKILIGEENQINSVAEYNLEQNYPNPFNPNTILKFAIAKEGNVNLSVYNILGERVMELKNEMMKPGYYEVEFNASSLASGVYFYQLKAGDFIQTKKMVLTK